MREDQANEATKSPKNPPSQPVSPTKPAKRLSSEMTDDQLDKATGGCCTGGHIKT
jgi:hypothetical protein